MAIVAAPTNVGTKIKDQLGSEKNIIIGFDAAGGCETLKICIPTTVKPSVIGNSQKLAPKNIKNTTPKEEAKKCPPIRFLAWEKSDFGTANNKKIDAPKDPIIDWYPDAIEIAYRIKIVNPDATPLMTIRFSDFISVISRK